MSFNSRLSIIIINFNQEKLTRRCLESIYQNTSGDVFEIILVDNGSRSGSLADIKKTYPDAIFLELPENTGFARAANLGAARSTGELLIFLNNDTLVSPGALGEMTGFINCQPDAAGCGGHLIEPLGRPDLGCAERPTFGYLVMAALGLDKIFKKSRIFNQYYRNFLTGTTPQEVAIISGADLMIKKEIFNQLGGFDEKIFFYYEDTDLCWRLNKIGFKLYYLPEVTIIHARGATIGGQSRAKFLQWRRSRLYFYKKNFSRSEFLKIRRFMLFTLAIRFIIFPFYWLASRLGLKNNTENYSLYFEAWRQVKNYE